jgi:serine/threonine protein kinase
MSDTSRSNTSSSESSSDRENPDSYGEGGYCVVREDDTLGNYTISNKIGYGQFATVWKTTCDRAIKVCRSDSDYSAMVQQEINILNEVRHSASCVQLLDHFFHEGPNGTHPVLVMDLYQMDLYELTRLHRHEEVPLPLPISKKIIRQLLEGLVFLESNDIVHTDIKPENILIVQRYDQPITADDDSIQVVLGDFGTAIHSNDPAHLYGTTYEYRSPEQLLANQHLSSKSDVWSVACVMYELFGLQTLFEPRQLELDFNEKRWASDASSLDSDDSQEMSNYEIDLNQLYLFTEMFGKFPRHMTKKYRRWFTARGELRGLREDIDELSLTDRLEDDCLQEWDLPVREITEFMLPMFRFNPKRRDGAAKMLRHSFLR